MFTWQVVALIAVVVVVGIVVLAVAGLRILGAVKRLSTTVAATGGRFADESGMLRARRAGLRVAIAQRKAVNTDFAPARVTSLKGRQERDLIG